MGTTFRSFTGTSFKEFQYFTGVTSLTSNAMNGAKFEYLILPSSLVTINNYALQSLTNLKEIIVPASVTTMGADIFRQCSNLKSAVFLGNITTFSRTCYQATSLTFVDINSVGTISYNAFQQCTALVTVIIRSTTPPTLNPSYTPHIAVQADVIYVPDSAVDTYKAANLWSNYASKIHPMSEYTG